MRNVWVWGRCFHFLDLWAPVDVGNIVCGFWKGNFGRVSLNRRVFAVLLVSGILLVAAWSRQV